MQSDSDLNRAWMRPLCISLLTFIVIFRALPFLLYPGIHFDSDQATFGLMALHLTQFKSLPLFMYGQKYMLAVQAWLAAPFFLLAGTSILTLKISTLTTNLITVFVLFEFLRKKLEFSDLEAMLLSLPIALPALSLSQQWMNASGGHIEPILYVILIFWFRNRLFLFPFLCALAVLHREYCMAAVLAAWVILYLENINASGLKKKGLIFLVCFVLILGAVQLIARKFSTNFFGASPPFKFNHGLANFTESIRWIGQHLALILGATPETDRTLAISFRDGNAAAGAILFVLIGIAAYASRKVEFKRFTFGLYLFLITAFVCGFYVLKLQSHDGLGMRYILLASFLPLACGVWTIAVPNPKFRLVGYSALILMSLFHAYDLSHYWYTLNRTQPTDLNGTLAAELEKRDIKTAIAPYWKAYDISFRTQERVQVASSEQIRIPEYQDYFANHLDRAVRIDDPLCKNVPNAFQIKGVWICSLK